MEDRPTRQKGASKSLSNSTKVRSTEIFSKSGVKPSSPQSFWLKFKTKTGLKTKTTHYAQSIFIETLTSHPNRSQDLVFQIF